MSRIVEILVGLNALGGIAAFLGIRWAGRKAHSQTIGRLRRDEDGIDDEPVSESEKAAKPDDT